MTGACLPHLLQLLGGGVSLWGVLRMAQPYTGAGGGLITLLASALVKGSQAKEAADWQLHQEDRLIVLQGLALVVLGFVLQLGASALTLSGHW